MEKYAVKMMEYLDISREAQKFFMNLSDKLSKNDEYIWIRKNYMNYVDGKETPDGLCNILENIANETGEHYYSVEYVFLLECLKEVRDRYEKEHKDFPFAWRIYGKAAELPAEEWPEDTTVQKGYKKWILDGNYATTAYGVRII